MAKGGRSTIIRMELFGDKELNQALARIDQKLRFKILAKAVRKATAPVRKAMKQLAPKDTGTLKKSIISKVLTYRRGGVFGIIGPANELLIINGRRYNASKYAHLIELGTSPHAIRPRRKHSGGKEALAFIAHQRKGISAAEKRSRSIVDSSLVVVSKVNHPGIGARPFLRPAWHASQAKALEEFSRKAREELAAEVKKAVASAVAKTGGA